MVFDDNFDTVINEYPLTMMDIKIFSYMKTNMTYGNIVTEKQIDIAKHFNIDKSVVSKSIKRLEEAKVVIRIGNNMFINPHFALKADPYTNDNELEKLISIADEIIKGTHLKRAVLYRE